MKHKELKESIRNLVRKARGKQTAYSVSDKAELGKITAKEAKILKAKTGFDLSGYERVVELDGIIHTIKKHGDVLKEKMRKQIAIIDRDFELIPDIFNTENVIYAGKDKSGQDVLLYEKVIGQRFYYCEVIRSRSKRLALKTMYKKTA